MSSLNSSYTGSFRLADAVLFTKDSSVCAVNKRPYLFAYCASPLWSRNYLFSCSLRKPLTPLQHHNGLCFDSFQHQPLCSLRHPLSVYGRGCYAIILILSRLERRPQFKVWPNFYFLLRDSISQNQVFYGKY